MKLSEYINKNFESKADFARKQGVKPQQVSEWINKDMVVHNGRLYSFRRFIKEL